MHWMRRLHGRGRLAHRLLALAALLLLAQAAGIVHRSWHAVPASHEHAVSATAFGEHAAGDADCRLIDQLLQADLLIASTPMALPLAAAPAEAAAALRAARLAPLWRQPARGPPTTA